MKKRSFVLFEVLIALALITLFSFILLSQPSKLYQKELSQLKTLEYERISRAHFLEQKHEIKKSLDITALPHSEKDAPMEFVKEGQLHLAHLPAQNYSIKQKLWIEKEKKGEDKVAALIRLKLFFFEKQSTNAVYDINYLMTLTEGSPKNVTNHVSTSRQASRKSS